MTIDPGVTDYESGQSAHQHQLKDLMLNEGRGTLKQVFTYLEALNDRRNPPLRDIDKYDVRIFLSSLPSHPAVSWGGEEFVLKVKRPTMTAPPAPPQAISQWLNEGWMNPSNTPTVVKERVANDGVPIAFDADPNRVLDYASWQSAWKIWAPTRLVENAVEKLYQNLYEQYSLLERDADRFELVLGDGMIRWDLPEGRVNHPLLILPVEIVFDAPNAEFTVIEGLRPIELYTAPLRSAEVAVQVLTKMRKQVQDAPEIHPLEDTLTSAFLAGVATSLDERGVFSEETPEDAEHLQVFRSRVLFRRNRSVGIAQAIRQVLDDLSEDAESGIANWLNGPPEGLMRFVGIETRPENLVAPGTEGQARLESDEDEETYFCKPANREQFKIVRKLKSNGCVLVQGPPGTGKTHTIANLIGHLLAEGKSVLVTSHTTKALSVVTEKVVEPLRPLCVSVLESDIKNRDQLEASVHGMASRLSDGTDAYERRSVELTAIRAEAYKRIRKLQNDLRMARMSEYEPIAYRGESYRPIEAGKIVARLDADHGWIPGDVVKADYPPLSNSEFETLYRSNSLVSEADEENFPIEAPDLTSVMTPEDLGNVLRSVSLLRSTERQFRSDLVTRPVTEDAKTIEIAISLIEETVSFFVSDSRPWKKHLVDLAQRGESETWIKLLQQAEQINEQVRNVDELHLRVAPKWKQYSYSETIPLCQAIEEHLKSGKKLRGVLPWQNMAWKKVEESLSVADGRPTSVEHFVAGRSLLEVMKAREEFLRVWNGRMVEISGPNIGDSEIRPERVALNYSEDIVSCLNWQTDFWPKLQAAVTATGFSCQVAIQTVPTQSGAAPKVERFVLAFQEVLLPALRQLLNKIKLDAAECELRTAQDAAQNLSHQYPDIPILRELAGSASHEDLERYQAFFGTLTRIYGKGKEIAERRSLLQKLSDVAPSWAHAIQHRLAGFDQPMINGDIENAWMWKQLSQELIARSKVSIQDIVSSLASARKDAEGLTASLVEAKSWLNLIKRTSMPMRLALTGYVQVLKRIGKGTGKRVPRFILEAQKFMTQCQAAVPVWVMPLTRVVESFDLSKTKFDVVIIDEASQLDLNGLLAMYLARQVIIVGDDKQVEPLAVGTNISEIEALIDEHLAGIPRGQLWDGKQSVYSLADGPFEPIRLREHFRCVPDIIRFSNQLSYGGEILALREDAGVTTKPFVVPYYVQGAYLEGSCNAREAKALVSILKACIESKEYDGKTFGIIHLVGEEGGQQSKYVERLAREMIGDVELQKRKFRCGNSAQFQGDERDVMFLSVVDVPRQGPLSLRSEDLYKKRFNVAASRARDQMWVIYSLDPDVDLKPGDLRRELICYAKDPTASERILQDNIVLAESDFEERVLKYLIDSGYSNVIPQYSVGAYRLDFAFRQGDLRVALECDGERFHGLDKLDEDLARQETLERLGWKFIRIRGNEFYRDQLGTMERVKAALSGLGVHRTSYDSPAVEQIDTDLLHRLKLRASEILQGGDENQPSEIVAASPETEPKFRDDLNQKNDSPDVDSKSDIDLTTNIFENDSSDLFDLSTPSPEVGLVPYREFIEVGLPDPKEASPSEMVSALVRIVEVEGPVVVSRLIDRYRIGAGYGRLKGPTRDLVVRSINNAISAKRITVVSQADEIGESVVCCPGQPEVLVRERGPRDLEEIPIEELAALANKLGVQRFNEETAFRELLNAYQLKRLTESARQRLSRALGSLKGSD